MNVPFSALELPYLPQSPKSYSPPIGVIGCGGIIKHHLQAYRDAGLNVVALCDPIRERVEKARDDFFPEADVFEDYRALLKRDEIEVVDVATHPAEREVILRDCLQARKHVLSQKPFVLDLDVGESLVELADRQQVSLSVNQNGRWAPHFSYARHAVAAGWLGTVFGAHLSVHWDHQWVKGTPFAQVKHLILYDYAIHWFDMLRCLLPSARALRVFASTTAAPNQEIAPKLLGQTLVEWDSGQSTLAFDAALPSGSMERTFVSGTQGSLLSQGAGNQEQTVTVRTQQGEWQPRLKGKWFSDGFRGTMGELLCSIEDKRVSSISAADNLHSLALCFAAVASAETGMPVRPGDIRKLPN